VEDCEVKVGRENLKIDLIVMPFEDYDRILGMDWLPKHSARVDCKNKVVQFIRPEYDVIEFKGNRVKKLKFVITGTKAWKMLKQDARDISLI
jgi:hypothetical protein